jgi:hypothetical protein
MISVIIKCDKCGTEEDITHEKRGSHLHYNCGYDFKKIPSYINEGGRMSLKIDLMLPWQTIVDAACNNKRVIKK